MDQIWALWLVVGRTNRRDVAPGGGKTRQIIKARPVQGRGERGDHQVSPRSLPGFPPVIWIQSRMPLLYQCTAAVWHPDSRADLLFYQRNAGQPNIPRWYDYDSTHDSKSGYQMSVLCLSLRTFDKLNIHYCETFFFKSRLKIPKVVFDWIVW